MKTIFLKTLQNHKWSLIAFSAINILLILVFVSMWPDLQGQSEQFAELLSSYPESLMKAMGIEVQPMLSSLEGFIGTEHYSLMWPLMMAFFAIGLGVNAIAGEVDEGTIEILFAQPLLRLQIYVSKLLAGVILMIALTVSSVLSVVPIAEIMNVEYEIKSHFTIAVLGAMFGLAIYGVSLLLSAVSSSKGKATSLLAGGLITMYALNIISALKENVGFLKYFSFFHYFDFNAALFDQTISLESITVFLGIGIASLLLGAAMLEKRDMAV